MGSYHFLPCFLHLLIFGFCLLAHHLHSLASYLLISALLLGPAFLG